ncbi:MAG: nicotinate-nucleotide--dimethylbenzimidazole phosphoribosyltransferase [Chloracidobacterium sp.]|nr:nicotinate-nucleotide--dimethylbenzimidazole phosphoribosyltransferase [Chloracidobacterium sp.]MDW8218439.1 nicotinate-nucleotide--dimethylbenzimidazole phosphoribosyltransferase [Acidobacteriota bacterium]
MTPWLKSLTEGIQPPDQTFAAKARARQVELVKPPGSLGRLETLATQLAAIQRTEQPQVRPRAIVVFCADHGVCAEGVSAFPSRITHQHLRNFIGGRAAVAVLAEMTQSELVVCDVGVDADVSGLPGVRHRKVRRGARNFAVEPALTPAEVEQAVRVGFETISELAERGIRAVAVGEMGIGNTTAAAAVTAALTGQPPEAVTGAGSGLAPEGLARKIAVVRQALEQRQPRAAEPLDILAKVGGLDVAAMCGAYLGCAACGCVAVVDGFVSTAAAALSVACAPVAREYMVFGHRSTEPGHQVLLSFLEATPLLHLDMRLGEASGAALALTILEAACRLHGNMATFREAQME